MNDLLEIESDDLSHPGSRVDPAVVPDDIPAVGEAISAGRTFSEGTWAGALSALVGPRVGAAERSEDPFETLLSSAAAMLMDHMPPLPQLLDGLTSDPRLVESIARAWSNVSRQLEQEAQRMVEALDDVMRTWKGAAAQAYAQRMGTLIGLVQGLAAGTGGLAAGFAIASAIVTVVQAIVKDLIADLVGRLIVYMVEAGSTLGTALPVAIGQAVTAIGATTVQVTRQVDNLTAAARTGQEIAERVIAAISQINSLIDSLRTGGGQAFHTAEAL